MKNLLTSKNGHYIPYFTPIFYHISHFFASFTTTSCIFEKTAQIGDFRPVFNFKALKASNSMLLRLLQIYVIPTLFRASPNAFIDSSTEVMLLYVICDSAGENLT